MDTADFDFELPSELIAQNPVVPRDHSRMLVMDRRNQSLEHKHFFDLPGELQEGDVLVLNDTKVVPARLFGTIPEVGTGSVEVLLLNEAVEGNQRVMAKPGKKFRLGCTVLFDEKLKAVVEGIEEDGSRLLNFNCSPAELQLHLDRIGHAPFPPYIKESTATREQYQTVYARDPGSSAAPTAGLHFTSDVFAQLKNKRISVEKVTLHVGRGTFQDVKVDHLEEHIMHSEHFELTPEVANRLNEAKRNGRRIIAVGTTSVRVLESCCSDEGVLLPQVSTTVIFIYPGYAWKFVDALVTNFHLPKSTLIMLVSSFAGKEFILNAYQKAIEEKYRFFSFGDCMLIK
ncbi:MAG: tRNA preQ1(34) S-adenosylmethionine ribosyltransferase-isomerase QueA [Verrucomicrobia bacterium]|nr:tRNA preQ1(34) S-adenosylmethionine ribosyltransferase-isomerase QueA [Verrucomicrobiota bacterium]MDA1066376.1 tRNA preQ1(34) S-adenosylmethionine ribosyltransferase-isomerase QueA [Verrucomicrobiota bacterium]